MRMSGAAMAVVIGCWTLLSTAQAAPPTVTPSPGYDARLQEQRAATTLYQLAPRAFDPRHPPKRLHDGAR